MSMPPIQSRPHYQTMVEADETNLLEHESLRHGDPQDDTGRAAGPQSGEDTRAQAPLPPEPTRLQPGQQPAPGGTPRTGEDLRANGPDPRSLQLPASPDKPGASPIGAGQAGGGMPGYAMGSTRGGASQVISSPMEGLLGRSWGSLGGAIGQFRLGAFGSQLAQVVAVPLSLATGAATPAVGGNPRVAPTPAHSPAHTVGNVSTTPVPGTPLARPVHTSTTPQGQNTPTTTGLTAGSATASRDGLGSGAPQTVRPGNVSGQTQSVRSGAHDEATQATSQTTASRQTTAAESVHVTSNARTQANTPLNESGQATAATSAQRNGTGVSPADQKVQPVSLAQTQATQLQSLTEDGLLQAPVATQRGEITDGQEVLLDALGRNYVFSADGRLRLRMDDIDGVDPLAIDELDVLNEQSMSSHGELSTHELVWKVVVPAFVGVGTLLSGATLGAASAAGATGMTGAFLLVAAAGIFGYGSLRGAANLRELADSGVSIDPRLNPQCRAQWIATGGQSLGSLASLAMLLI